MANDELTRKMLKWAVHDFKIRCRIRVIKLMIRNQMIKNNVLENGPRSLRYNIVAIVHNHIYGKGR